MANKKPDGISNFKLKPHSRNWFKKYLKENPLKVGWAILLAIGLMLLFSYFLHIEYFPNFDLQTAGNLLLSLTYMGVIYSICFSFLLLVPNLFVSLLIRRNPLEIDSRKFKSDILLWGFYCVINLVALFAIVLTYVYFGWDVAYGLAFYLGVLVLLSALSVRFRQRHYKPNIHDENATPQRKSQLLKLRKLVLKHQWIRFGGIILTGLLQIFPLLVLSLVLSKASALKDDDYAGYMRAAISCALQLNLAGGAILYIFMHRKSRRYWYVGVIIFFLLPLTLNFFSNAAGMFPMLLAQTTKIGNFRAERMIISSKSCSIITSAIGIKCDQKQVASIELCNVHVMSRVGSETYLRVATNQVTKPGHHVVVPLLLSSADITGMQIDFNNKSYRLDKIDEEVGKSSSECSHEIPNLITLRGDTSFSFDGFELNDNGRTQIAPLIQAIKNSPSKVGELRIVGHADSIGKAKHNDWLALQRALQVRVYIEHELQNLPNKVEIKAESKGSTELLINNCGKIKNRIACEAPNRRVEITIVPSDTGKSM